MTVFVGRESWVLASATSTVYAEASQNSGTYQTASGEKALYLMYLGKHDYMELDCTCLVFFHIILSKE